MPLFPDVGVLPLDGRDKDIRGLMETFYMDSITLNQSYWGEAERDQRVESGDTQNWLTFGQISPYGSNRYNFNKVRRIVNMVDGYQRRNRKSTIIVPVENGDAKTADQFTKVMMWINNQEGILETISEAFHGALVTGMNLLQVWVDYRSDPISGNIKVDNCAYNSFLIDPYFKKPDLSDCRGIWKRSYLSKRECMSLLPDGADEILGLTGNDNRDGKFQFMPEARNFNLKNLLTYDEFHYRAFRDQTLLVDPNTGEVQEWRGNREDLAYYLQLFPELVVQTTEVPTTRTAILVQGKCLYDGPNPLGIDSYNFIPVFTYYTPQLPTFPQRVQGIVRGLRDAQYLYNHRKILELDSMEAQLNAPLKVKEGSLVNDQDAHLTGPGRVLFIKHDALMTDVEQMSQPLIPPTTLQMSEMLGKEIMEIAGASEVMLGAGTDNNTAGILEMARQGAGLTTLQGIFDQLDTAQKLLGRVIMDYVQIGFAPGKVKRILGDEEPMPQFYNKAFGRYHTTVEEGVNTVNQRQLQLIQMINLKQLGVMIPDQALLEASTFQNKDKIMKMMAEEAKQAQELQQLQLQVQMQETQARTNLANARAVADEGLGIERLSRIPENQALAEERRAAAIRDEETGILNLVKAFKELDAMDIQHLSEFVNMHNTIKIQQHAESQAAIQNSGQKPLTQRMSSLKGDNRSSLKGDNRSSLKGNNRSSLKGNNRSSLKGNNRSSLKGGNR
jgi:hypothetical protein